MLKSALIKNLDTDSIMLGYTGENLEDIVPEAKRESWEKVVKEWFATEEVRSQKTPGLLKTEKKITDGHFVALTPKPGFNFLK